MRKERRLGKGLDEVFKKVIPGPRVCLKCEASFMSEDRINNRICPKCNERNLKEFVPHTKSSSVDTGNETVQVPTNTEE